MKAIVCLKSVLLIRQSLYDLRHNLTEPTRLPPSPLGKANLDDPSVYRSEETLKFVETYGNTRLRRDDIQRFALMIYTPTA